jgi:hypothetical protein
MTAIATPAYPLAVQPGVPLRDQLPPQPGAKTSIPEPLVAAVRAELRDLVDGDIGDALVLNRIEQLAARARELFSVVRGSPAPARQGTGVAYGGSSVATYNMGTFGGVVGTVVEPEQFGARAIRELVSLIPEVIAGQKKESPADIAEAMRIAKQEGDEELHAALRERLLGKKLEKKSVIEAKAEPASTSPKETGRVPRSECDEGEDKAHHDHEAHETHESEDSSEAAQ